MTDSTSVIEETAQDEFKRSGMRRVAWSSAIALLLLGLFAIFGPSSESVRRHFEFIGAEGPLVIMQELSIEEGHENREQMQQFMRKNPPPPSYEVEERPPDNTGLPELLRTESEAPPVEAEEYANENFDPDMDEMDLVEMNLEQMTSPNYTIIHLVKPQYPSLATEADRRIPRVDVTVAIFVSSTGDVTSAYVHESNAGSAFEEVALRAVRQWKFQLHVDGPGIWIKCTIGFLGPYA